MTAPARSAGGRFAPGNNANPRGRPSTASRMHLVIERELARLGATPEEIKSLVEAASDPLRAAAAISVMVAAVAERREQDTHPSGPLT